MSKATTFSLSVAVLLFSAQAVYAADAQDMSKMNTQIDKSSESVQMHKGHGVANKINARSGKVNITHEAIDSMNWPKMTMDFSVQNKAELEAIKPGMPVDFELTQKGKGYTITNIKPAK